MHCEKSHGGIRTCIALFVDVQCVVDVQFVAVDVQFVVNGRAIRCKWTCNAWHNGSAMCCKNQFRIKALNINDYFFCFLMLW